jgi:hypothetical protein
MGGFIMRCFIFAGTSTWRLVAGAILVVFLAGCAATVELAAPEEDLAAKRFITEEGKANIYVTREDQFTGSAVLFQLVVDQHVIGGIAPGTYHMIPVEPGHHSISVTTAENQSIEEVNAEASHSYFFEVKPQMGWFAARAEVDPLSEEEGRAAIAENALAEGIDSLD